MLISRSKCFQWFSPSNHGATDSFSLALFNMVSGSGSECRTIAPYRPYSAIMVLLPQHFSVLRHFALRFWNQTWKEEEEEIPKIYIYENILPQFNNANKNLTIIIEATLEKNKDAWKGVKVTSSGRSGYILAKVSKSQRQASAAHIFRPTCPFNDHCLLIGTPGARRAISFMRAVPR